MTNALTTLHKVEKVVVWVVGVAATLAGSLSGAEAWLPKPVATVLVAAGPVLIAVERIVSAMLTNAPLAVTVTPQEPPVPPSSGGSLP